MLKLFSKLRSGSQRTLKVLILTVLVVMALGCSRPDPAISEIDKFITTEQVDKSQKDWKTTLNEPPQVTFDPESQYFWLLKTSHGELRIRLMPEVAPKHVSSTIYLTRIGMYDDTIFHRVIDNFMAQGGDPRGTGQGNPGYRYAGEFDDSVKHDRPGLLSMANAGPNTDGSQFFLTFKATPWLDGKHTIFGEVVDGLDTTLKTIESLGSRRGKTKEEIKIISATIEVERI